MAKGKYQQWIEPEGLTLLEGWARDGLTDEQIAHNVGITTKTLYEWKNKYGEISEALKKGKEVVDIEVENSLLKKATGYTVDLVKTFKVRRVEYNESGKKILEQEELVQGIDQMHVPADTTAQIFWLKNRRPDKWRDKPAEGEERKAHPALIALLELEKRREKNG